MPRYQGITAGLVALAVATLMCAATPSAQEQAPFSDVGFAIADQGNRALIAIRAEARADLAKLNPLLHEVNSDFVGAPLSLAIPPSATNAGGSSASASARASQ